MLTREKFFKKLASFVIRKYKLILLISVFLLILSIFSIMNFLTIKSNMKDFLGNRNKKVAQYNKIIKKFKSASSVLVVIEGKKKDMIKFSNFFANKLYNDNELKKYIKKVDYKIPIKFYIKKGLLLSKKKDLQSLKYLFEKLGFYGFFKGINKSFSNSYSSVNTHHREHETVRFLDGFQVFLENLIKYLKTKNVINADKIAQKMVDAITIGEPYYYTPKKNIQLMNVYPTIHSDQIDKVVKFIKLLRKKVKGYMKQFTKVKVTLGGDLPLIADDMISAQHDFSVPSNIALLLVFLLFYLSFRNFFSTLFSMISLIFGIIIAFGIAIAVIQELNQISSFFLVLLVGLGIDYGIHILSHFLDYYREDGNIENALSKTYIDSGMGIIIGAITTSFAFFTLMFTTAKAFRQLGFFAGIGIITCLISLMVLLPALIVLKYRKKVPPKSKIGVKYNFMEPIGKFVVKKKYYVIVFFLILTGLAIFYGKNIGFQYNMLKLYPETLPSVKVVHKINNSMSISPTPAVVAINDLNRTRKLTKRFKLLAHVGRVDSISDYIPPHGEQSFDNERTRMKIIREIRQFKGRNNYIKANKNIMSKIIYELKDFRDRIIELSYAETLGGLKLVKAKRIAMTKEKNLFNRLIATFKNLDAKGYKKLQFLEKLFSDKMNSRINEMTQISVNPKYPVITVANLPNIIKKNYISDNGKHFLIRIYGFKNIWEEKYLKSFSRAASRIHEGVTGTPVMFLDIALVLKSEGSKAVIMAFAAIFILLIINYSLTGKEKPAIRIPRGLLKTVLTIIPLVIGTILMIAGMKLFGFEFNLFNVTGIPLILGMGIDDGVHITQRYITEGYKNIPGVLKHTGKGVLITTLTTMVSFGAIGFLAINKGMSTFGVMLFIGMATCMIVSVMFLPALLQIFLNKNKQKNKE